MITAKSQLRPINNYVFSPTSVVEVPELHTVQAIMGSRHSLRQDACGSSASFKTIEHARQYSRHYLAARHQLQPQHQYQPTHQQQLRPPLQQSRRRKHAVVAAAAGPQEQLPVLPEGVDLHDPELQQQIDAMLRELDPDLLMVRSEHCRGFTA